jgi:alcohol dehydrogenase
MTPFAAIWLDDRRLSLEHAALKPKVVVRAAANLAGAPREAVLFAALDAMSHAFEAIWNKNANPASDAAAHSALARLSKLLPTIIKSHAPEEGLLQIAADAGCAISITRTSVAHSISYPFTYELNVPHGLAASFALPELTTLNLENDSTDRLAIAANALSCAPLELPDVITRLFDVVGANEFSRAYLLPNAHEGIQGRMIDRTRSVNNICSVTEDQARKIAERALKRIWATT